MTAVDEWPRCVLKTHMFSFLLKYFKVILSNLTATYVFLCKDDISMWLPLPAFVFFSVFHIEDIFSWKVHTSKVHLLEIKHTHQQLFDRFLIKKKKNRISRVSKESVVWLYQRSVKEERNPSNLIDYEKSIFL